MEKGNIDKTRNVYLTFDAKEIARFVEKRSKLLKIENKVTETSPGKTG